MRLRALAAAAVLVLAAGMGAFPASAATASHPAAGGPHSDQCFGHGHSRGVAKPGANCWEGAICLRTMEAGHVYLEFCMSTASRSGIHIVTTDRQHRAKADYWDVVLVGYVTFSSTEGRDWPFRSPTIDQRYRGYPVVNIHRVIDHKSQKDVCIGGIPAAAGEPITAEVTGYVRHGEGSECSPVGQGKRNTHNTFMVWHPGNENYEQRIIIVNYTNANTNTRRFAMTSADGSGIPGEGVNDEVWYLPRTDPGLDDYQLWFRAYPSTDKK